MSEDYQRLLRLLADAAGLLGPCTPQPALFEEVVRAACGHAVQTARWRQTAVLLQEIRDLPDWAEQLYALLCYAQAPWEARMLAAILCARSHREITLPPLTEPEDPALRTLLALAYFPIDTATTWYLRQLKLWLHARPAPTDQPELLPVLCFLKGLSADALSPLLFAGAIRQASVLHPQVAAHRPFQRLHRLLDYVGLSGELPVQQQYRRLVAEIWPQAHTANYADWQWITVPGGPDRLPFTIAELQAEEWTLPRLHELKYLPLPHADHLREFLATLSPPLQQLLHWLRPDTARYTILPGGWPAQQWMQAGNQAAASTAYANPAWWDEWRREGLPVAREVLGRLQQLPLPPASPATPEDRHQWLAARYLPHYRQHSANLLLAQAAEGASLSLLLHMADEEDLPAVRALALAPEITAEIIDLLRRQAQQGSRPLQAAAQQSLTHLARRQGLPGIDELHRQSLLAAAWEPGPLNGDRVRIFPAAGGYRLRLALQRGQAELTVLGSFGPVTNVPEALRRSDAYRQARAAQQQVQAQYRLFKQSLEKDMLESRPLAIGEFTYLLSNPIFAHLAERLVWHTSHGETILWAGPGRWETRAGTLIELENGRNDGLLFLQVAHPVTLTRTLVAWQALAADRRLVQPFKQLFREIYTPHDRAETDCTRFAGRAIDPQRAYALLRAAGFAPGAGIARRNWPRELTAHLCWAEAAVSHDLFGPQRKAAVPTGGIWFTRGDARLAIAQVDEIVFSETLRAADLLTTRAAVGDADLTSRETLALRVTLLREVSRAFGLTNIAVREEGGYALVLGAHATYRVNLANGAVLLEPEGRQILLPQLAQHWQPSEDLDTTTRILDLILLLARDETIDDLTFLAQLA